MIAASDDGERLVTRVGLWSLAVLVVVIAFFVFVFGRIDWGARVRVRVFFHQVASLHEGAPFVVAGRAIGKAGHLVDNVDGMVTDLRAGKGTAGALLVKEDIYADLRELIRDLKRNPWKFFWKE